jgi:hypothetical protein
MNPSGADSTVQREGKKATENNHPLIGEGIALFKAIPLFAFAKNKAVTSAVMSQPEGRRFPGKVMSNVDHDPISFYNHQILNIKRRPQCLPNPAIK